MSETHTIVSYDSTPAPSRWPAAVAFMLIGVQVAWGFPAAFGLFVLLADNGLLHAPLPNLAGAAVVVAPSLAAAALAARVLLRRRRHDRRGLALAAAALVAALCFIAYVFSATVDELRHPGLTL